MPTLYINIHFIYTWKGKVDFSGTTPSQLVTSNRYRSLLWISRRRREGRGVGGGLVGGRSWGFGGVGVATLSLTHSLSSLHHHHPPTHTPTPPTTVWSLSMRDSKSKPTTKLCVSKKNNSPGGAARLRVAPKNGHRPYSSETTFNRVFRIPSNRHLIDWSLLPRRRQVYSLSQDKLLKQTRFCITNRWIHPAAFRRATLHARPTCTHPNFVVSTHRSSFPHQTLAM